MSTEIKAKTETQSWNTVYFGNQDILDVNAIRLMGVSVKKSDNPIGYFGTGLKFAIATLLRNNQKISIITGGQKFKFSTRKCVVRGSEYHAVYMNDEQLGFTTELGRDWEMWQAYRELHSNTLDENGLISHKPLNCPTIIKVEGQKFYSTYEQRAEIFIEGIPLYADSEIEIYAGPSREVYYHGVRAGYLSEICKFKYNFLKGLKLTEDRTITSEYSIEWILRGKLPQLTDLGIIEEIVRPSDYLESTLSYDRAPTPSKEFLDSIGRHMTNVRINKSLVQMYMRLRQETTRFKEVNLNNYEHDLLLQSFKVLHRLKCSLSPEDVIVAETLGPNVLGLYQRSTDQIYLAWMCLDRGLETVVATLYEEWLHKVHKLEDESRGMQDFLLQKLAAVVNGNMEKEITTSYDDLPF